MHWPIRTVLLQEMKLKVDQYGPNFMFIPACPRDPDGDIVVGTTDFLSLLARLFLSGTGLNNFLGLLANWAPCPERA